MRSHLAVSGASAATRRRCASSDATSRHPPRPVDTPPACCRSLACLGACQAFAELVNEVVEEKTFEELVIRKAASASAADESVAEQPDVPEPDVPEPDVPDVLEPDVIEPDSELDADSDDDEDEGTGDAVSTAGGNESPQKQGNVGLVACARPVRGRPILLRTRALQLLGLVEHGVFEALGRGHRFGWRSPFLPLTLDHRPTPFCFSGPSGC